MSLDIGEKIGGKVVAVPPITYDVIQRGETLRQTQQQPFRSSQMLQYKWRPGHDVSVDDANLDVPNNKGKILVPNPVKQQQIVQDPIPFTILANDEYSKKDNEAQQVLPDRIENKGPEDAINTKQNVLNLTSKIKERLRKIKERLRKFKERKISRKSRSTDQG